MLEGLLACGPCNTIVTMKPEPMPKDYSDGSTERRAFWIEIG